MIPRVIHQLWLGSDIPAEYRALTNQWRDFHATGWQHILWTDDTLPWNIRRDYLYLNAEQISAEPWQYRADVARYHLLNEFGGVWADVDFVPQRRIDTLCGEGVYAWMAWEQEPSPTGVYHGQEGWLNNAIIGSIPGHPFLLDALRLLPKARFNRGGNTVKSGPQFITPIALRHGVTCYPKKFFYPYLWNELDKEGMEFPDAYGVHLWNNRRKRP